MKRSLVHSLFSLSLSLSRVCVFCFLERALAPQGPSQVKLFSLSPPWAFVPPSVFFLARSL